MTAEAQTAVAPIVRSVVVACSQEHAFRVFTERIADWWPLDQYSIGEDKAESVTIEPRVGGRILETIRDADPAEWGSILAWDPFDRVVIEWRVRPDNPPTEVEVRNSTDRHAQRPISVGVRCEYRPSSHNPDLHQRAST